MANGFTQKLCQVLGITDASSTGSQNTTTGIPDPTKTTSLNITINNDLAAGVGAVRVVVSPGSAQTFTSLAAAWLVVGFGPTGGTLIKADGTAFAVAGLPTAGAHYRSVIAYCTDGVRVCNGSAWETCANAD